METLATKPIRQKPQSRAIHTGIALNTHQLHKNRTKGHFYA